MRVIVSDFDNTFYDNNFDDNINNINDFVDNGNLFVIATGRNIQSLLDTIGNKKIKCQYYICNDGAIIYDKYLNTIYRKDINISSSRQIFRLLKTDEDVLEAKIDTTNGYTIDFTRSANKIIIKPKNIDSANDILYKILNKFNNVSGYVSKNWININDIYANKGNAIKFIMMYGNLKINQVFTIGDDINDLSMMKGFISFSIKHNDKIKYNSRYVTNSFKEFINILKK